MPLDISKLRLEADLPDATGEVGHAIRRLASGDDTSSVSRILDGSMTVGRMLADIERSNRLVREAITSPIQQMIERERSLVGRISALALGIPSHSVFDSMFEQSRLLGERLSASSLGIDTSALARVTELQSRGIAEAARALGSYDAINTSRFALPAFDHFDAIGRMMAGYTDPLLHVSRQVSAAMESMRSPWLSIDNPLVSASAFTEMQNIGRMLKVRAPFGIDFAATLRDRVGDWRDPVGPSNEVDSHEAREQLYVDHGLDADLVQFPDEAFDETVVLAGLVPFDEEADAELSAGLRRSRQMFALLQHLEAALRRMIEQAMNETFGLRWMFGRTGNTMADEWEAKKLKDQIGTGTSLIEYADFTDYEIIILRKDNWSQVFRHRFGRRDADVRESFQRLYPARIATMHGRPLGRDDYLLAALEVRRLMLAIARQRSH